MSRLGLWLFVTKPLEVDCELEAERVSLQKEERRSLSWKVRFDFQMASFASGPKSDAHPSNVMQPFFQQDVHMTVFDTPEYQRPWCPDCAPKGVMGISDSSRPREDHYPCVLTSKDHED